MFSLFGFKQKSSSPKSTVDIKGKLSKVSGVGDSGFENSSLEKAQFYSPHYLKYKASDGKLYISEKFNRIIRSIKDISVNEEGKWKGSLEVEVGQPEQEGYESGDRKTCKLRLPTSFDWDLDDNMYICNVSCICKVDSKTNQVTLVAGQDCAGHEDGDNSKAYFHGVAGIVCHQTTKDVPPELYVCDTWNQCIRKVDIKNGKTTTLAGMYGENGDVDGKLQVARFSNPLDIVKDGNNLIFYISDNDNNKIRMIDVKKGKVLTVAGKKDDKSILEGPCQLQVVGSYIYVVCYYYRDGIVRIDKESKAVTKVKFIDKLNPTHFLEGIAFNPTEKCFYLSDKFNIYKLE